MAFAPPEYCRLFTEKKAYQAGVTDTPGPPPPLPRASYAPGPVLSCISPAPSYSNHHEEPVSQVESRCHILVFMNAMFLWVSVIIVPFLQAHKTYTRKNILKRDFKVMGLFPSRLAIGLVQNVHVLTLYVPRILHQFALDWRSSTLIPWKWSPETRHFEYTLHGGNLRKFQEVQRFCVWKATFWNIRMTPNLDLTLSTSLKLHPQWMATIHNLSNCVQPSREGVDKTRNMEHPGTSRNMKKLKYFSWKKNI